MNIMIGDQWINLDNVQLIGVFDSGICFTFGHDETITIPMTTPGAKSAWAWLQKTAIVFDESTDAELDAAQDNTESTKRSIGYMMGIQKHVTQRAW